MKKIIKTIILIALLCASITSLLACSSSAQPLVIKVQADKMQAEDTLKDYMDRLQAEGEFTFEVQDGMITSINGKSGNTNEYWMLYTDDAENANTAWGTYEYNNETFGSAIWGVEGLKIKEGCTYILVLQAF